MRHLVWERALHLNTSMTSQAVLLSAVFCVGACQFDATGEAEDSIPGAERPGDTKTGNDTPTEPTVLVATSENTKHGSLALGNYIDSHAVDGNFETILAELAKGNDEKLEHNWLFEAVPAGVYEISMVVLPTGPNEYDGFSVEYASEGVKGHTELFVLEVSDSFRSYQGLIDLRETGDLELRTKLKGKTKAEGTEPARMINVDFLGLHRD